LAGLCPDSGDLWNQFEKNMAGMHKILQAISKI
jgi:hypothetical protein